MTIRNAIASLAVKDLPSASHWYQKLFGRAADSTPMSEVVEWKFERGGWLQVFQLPERAGHGSVTLAVGDIDEQIRDLQRCGIDSGPRMDSDKVKVIMIKDPDGNSIAFAQAIDPTIAH